MNRQERRAAERQAKSDPAAGARLGDQAFAGAEQMRQAGRNAEAEQLCRQALVHDPRHARSLNMLGVLSLEAGRLDLAADFFGRAVAADGGVHIFHNNLGSALRELGREAEAAQAFGRAVAIKPDYARGLNNLGQVLTKADPAAAAAAFRQVLSFHPRDLEALFGLAVLLHTNGALDEAGPLYERAVAIAPDNPGLAENLAGLLLAQGRMPEAIAALERLLKLTPRAVQHWLNLAGALESQARITEAAAAYRQAIVLDPNRAAAFNGLGNALANLGQLDESVAAYRRAIALAPDYVEARSNLLMTLHSLDRVTAADILAEAKAYGARFGAAPARTWPNSRDPERPLRVGYICADFRVHPVGFFLERVLAAHDPRQVEAVLYNDTRFADSQTARLRGCAAAWRETVGKDDAEVARMIAADRIDILIDLAGHTGWNRLALFGHRAAPVQASWLGYFGTTGVGAIDYIVADEVVLPSGDEAVFTETPVRLPAPYLCWSPPTEDVAVAPFPGLSLGVATFGCFNNRAKITADTVAVWSKILRRAEGSSLFLKSWSLADQGNQDGLRAAFAGHGVAADRLIFEGLSPRAEGLAAYHRVDIALDPFPFGGCTTTADTLWMGVPVVTVAGARWSGRMSQTILKAVGLEDWVAPDLDAYVEMAVRAAGDLTALAPVRGSLRARVEQSRFCDGSRFTANLEAAYRQMWRAWCAAP
jgi:predicted O-linked N-acetylglucosamine transferase (SPINDLY family)